MPLLLRFFFHPNSCEQCEKKYKDKTYYLMNFVVCGNTSFIFDGEKVVSAAKQLLIFPLDSCKMMILARKPGMHE